MSFGDVAKVLVGVGAIIGGALSGNWGLIGLGAAMTVDGLGLIPDPQAPSTNLANRQSGMLLTNTENPDAPVPLVYGTCRIGSIVNDYRVDEASEDRKDLYIPAVFCHGSRHGQGIAEIVEIYLEDKLAIDSAEQRREPFDSENLHFAKILGTDSENWADETIDGTDLATVTTDWDKSGPPADYGKGLAGVILKLVFDREVYPRIPVINAVVKGNHVEDTRDEITGSVTFGTSTITHGDVSDGDWADGDFIEITSGANAGTYLITDVSGDLITVDATLSATVYSTTLKRWAHPDNGGDNPALCIRDYLLSSVYGCDLDPSEIDDTSFETMANYCDESVSTPAGNITRYTCNGWLNTGRKLKANLDELLSSCRGNLIKQAGTYRLFITRAVTASTFELTRKNIIGDWQFANAGIDAKINVARCRWIDPLKDYKPELMQWPNAGDSNSYLTADNGWQNRAEYELPLTQNEYRVEHIAMIRLKESRQGITFGVTCSPDVLRCQIGDRVPVTHDTPGWTSKSFWIMGMGILPDGNIRVVVREYDATSYTHESQNTASAEPDTDLPNPFVMRRATAVTVEAKYRQIGASESIPEILVKWTDSDDPFLDHYELEITRISPYRYLAFSFSTSGTITRPSGSWYDDGYRVGDKFAISSATDANNEQIYTITSVDSATQVTVTPAPGTTRASDTARCLSVNTYKTVATNIPRGLAEYRITPIEVKTESETWIVRLVAVNVIGVRAVSGSNLIYDSDDLSQWTNVGCVLTGSQSDPDGGTNAYLVEDNSTGSAEYIQTADPMFIGFRAATASSLKRLLAFATKQGTADDNYYLFYDLSDSAIRGRIWVHWSGGVPTVTVMTETVTLIDPIDLGSGWYLIQFKTHGLVPGNYHVIQVYPAYDGTVTDTGSVYLYRITSPDGDRFLKRLAELVGTSGAPGGSVTFSHGITNIDNTDSPYDVQDGDVFIQVDCTSGNVTINLPKTTEWPGRRIAFRVINPTLGTVTLTAASGDTSEITNIGTDTYTHVMQTDPANLYWREVANNI